MNDQPPTPLSAPQKWGAFRIAGLYLLIGGLWIVFSDELAAAITSNSTTLTALSILKGWGYVLVTTLLLYWLIRRYTAGLRESEARYRSLFQNNHSVMLLLDSESGDIIDANPAACAFYGYPHVEITHLKIYDISCLTREQIFAEMVRARQEQCRHFFFQHRLASGEVREVEVYSGPITFNGKQLLYSIVHDISGRKQVEEQLHYQAKLVENVSDAIIATDINFNITAWNKAAETIYGWLAQEVLGQPSMAVLKTHYVEGGREKAQQQLFEEGRWTDEVTQHHKDGTVIYVLASVSLLKDSMGQPVGVVTLNRDITQRKQAEDALQRSHENLRLLIEQAPVCIAMFDCEMCYLAASHRWIEEYGRGQQNLIGLSHYDIHPDLPPEWLDIHRQGLAGTVVKNDDDLWIQADGTRHWLRWAVHPWRDAKDQIGGILISAEDITVRKRVEEALKRSEASLAKAQQIAHLGSWELNLADLGDVNRNKLHWSDEVYRIFGYQPGEIEPSNELFFQAVPAEDRPLIEQGVAQAIAQKKTFSTDHRILLPDGTERIVHEYADVICDEETGRPLQLFGTVQDITERNRVEEELRQTATELARSNTELEQFAYVSSHDLQEPLRAVTSMLQLLQQRYAGQLDARADEFIRHAVEGASRMQTLITDLLTFSRVGTRGQVFQLADCAAILTTVLANVAVAIAESGAVITYDPLPTIMADPTQLTQLFQNLISNAIKFHRDDCAPAIHIGVVPQQDEYIFVVRDNGIGMEAQYFERIFGVFQRLHTRREYAGTGIGLAICKKIVERHGGRIWVESAPRQGSTFYFTLPIENQPFAEAMLNKNRSASN